MKSSLQWTIYSIVGAVIPLAIMMYRNSEIARAHPFIPLFIHLGSLILWSWLQGFILKNHFALSQLKWTLITLASAIGAWGIAREFQFKVEFSEQITFGIAVVIFALLQQLYFYRLTTKWYLWGMISIIAWIMPVIIIGLLWFGVESIRYFIPPLILTLSTGYFFYEYARGVLLERLLGIPPHKAK